MTVSRYDRWLNTPVQLDGGEGGAPYRMKHESGVVLVMAGERAPVVVQSASGVTVSTLTPLTGWMDLGNYQRLLFQGSTDGSQNILITVEFSDDGQHPDSSTYTATMSPAGAGSVEIGPNLIHRWWRFSANSANFSNQPMSWKIIGVPRVA